MASEESLSLGNKDKWISIKGQSTILIVVLAVSFAAIIYYVRQDSMETRAQTATISINHAEAMKSMDLRSSQEHESLISALRENTRVTASIPRAIDRQSLILLLPDKEQKKVLESYRADGLRTEMNGR